MSSSCYTSAANLSTSAPKWHLMEMMLGLFKTEFLIDIIGTFNGGTNFSIDETIRRKATVTAPSTTFNKLLNGMSLH
jgi:hypothetical protein